MRSQYRNVVSVCRYGSKEARWGPSYNADWIALPFKMLLNIVEFDLANVYFTVGDVVLKQSNGAPIGGFISSLYGNVVCAKAEYQWLTSLGADQRLFVAARCQDDTLAFVSYEPAIPESVAFAQRVRSDILENRVYAGGLSVKEVSIPEQRARFIGNEVVIGDSAAYSVAFNRNWADIRSGKQRFPRFHHWHSFSDNRSKRGVVVGALKRIRRQCTHGISIVLEAWKLWLELHALCYPLRVFSRAVAVVEMAEQRQNLQTIKERDRREHVRDAIRGGPEVWRSVQSVVVAFAQYCEELRKKPFVMRWRGLESFTVGQLSAS